MSADQRPELGTLTVGQTVVVLPTGTGQRGNAAKPTPARIVKVGRVWIDVQAEDGFHLPYYDVRFRKDTQHNGSSNSTGRGRFVTEAQYAWDLRQRVVRQYLRESGVTVEPHVRSLAYNEPSTPGPWHGRELELANLLRAHEGLDPL